MRQLMQEYSVYFSSSFSILSLASGACLFIFSEKPNMDTQAILSPPTFGASCRYPVIFPVFHKLYNICKALSVTYCKILIRFEISFFTFIPKNSLTYPFFLIHEGVSDL